ncbi:acyltransferase Pun1-like [Cornus florida]|uniref:acyltransferase Pun1-like n=1 Tax=Cornus florida TaxID=4283 RepID=UPI00289B55E6|nr:acyltransferase Pun1-like [Cornus florida]
MGELGTIQVKIISREVIKPSSPTPHHLRNYKLSLLDQFASHYYVPRVLFYSNNNIACDSPPICTNANNKSHQLQKSLSEILTLYYPFAGILKDDGASIDCNDEGVEFLKAQIDSQLCDILKQPTFEALRSMFPSDLQGNNSSYKGRSLVVIQVSHFACGGMAIGVCMSHKIADGSTMANFLKDWATTARGHEIVPSPHFISLSSGSSPIDDPLIQGETKMGKVSSVTRRFVFDASKLAELKAVITCESAEIDNPSRVEVVTALLYKCAMAASKANSRSTSRPSILRQVANMRPKMVPPLPENSVGNFAWHFDISVADDEEVNLHGLVGQLRESRTKFYNKYAENVTVNEWLLVVREFFKEVKELFERKRTNNVDFYISNSMCRYPFYKVDFGWGKPIWVYGGGANATRKNIFSLVDSNKEGGIEAWVSLGEMEMSVFERDEELLSFAQLNPSVLDIA